MPEVSDCPATTFNLQQPLDKVVDTCVHCGFCLSTCPSYRVLGNENDSPRGRIYLMDALNKADDDARQIPLSPTTVSHFDSCLGCLACVTICPSGVGYDKLIAATRPQIEQQHQRPLVEKIYRQLIFSLFPYPDRLRLLLWPLLVYRQSGLQQLVRSTKLLPKVSPHLAAMESVLPAFTAADLTVTYPEKIAATASPKADPKKHYRVGMVLGCVQRLFFDRVNQATIRVLTANGYEVVIPPSQGCCAALPQHQGQTEQAQTLARQMVDSFRGLELDAIIINAAGCGHTLKEYGDILAGDTTYQHLGEEFSHQVKDIQEFLASIDFIAPLNNISDRPLPVVYQDACHLLHGQKISVQPRDLLKRIPQVQLLEPVDAALCCGSAGVYNMLQPEVAEELGQQKVTNLVNTGASIIASANPGCSLQISKHLAEQGRDVPVYHPIELLDMSIRGVQLPS
jgi:glycolate oxidase iron-sulfur subunit